MWTGRLPGQPIGRWHSGSSRSCEALELMTCSADGDGCSVHRPLRVRCEASSQWQILLRSRSSESRRCFIHWLSTSGSVAEVRRYVSSTNLLVIWHEVSFRTKTNDRPILYTIFSEWHRQNAMLPLLSSLMYQPMLVVVGAALSACRGERRWLRLLP